MTCFRAFVIAALMVAAVSSGSSLRGAGKKAPRPPRRPAPKVQPPKARLTPKPKPKTNKKPSQPKAPKKAAPKVKAAVPSKVKPPVHKPAKARSSMLADKHSKTREKEKIVRNTKEKDKHIEKEKEKDKRIEKGKETDKRVRKIERPTRVHRFARFNENTREFRIDRRWWHSIVASPTRGGAATRGGASARGGPSPGALQTLPRRARTTTPRSRLLKSS